MIRQPQSGAVHREGYGEDIRPAGRTAAPPAGRSSAGRKSAIVIGSGFGGLAAAVRLAARGMRVTVLERLDQPGGRARVFEQDGFRFDAGPTIITAPFLFEELWSLAGRRFEDDVELRSLSPFYRICFDDGAVFDYHGDEARMRAEIERFSSDDYAGYLRFRAVARELCRVGFERLAHQPFGSWKDMLNALPDLMRLQAWRSVYGLVARYIRNEHLRTVFSFHPLLVGGNPFRTTAVYALINDLERRWGVHYAMGGTGTLVSGLVRLLGELGGSLRTGCEVEEIRVENGSAVGVRLRGGERLASDFVVSNADAEWTYRHLVPAEHRRHWNRRRLDRLRPSMSLFVWYFGTRRTYPEIPHHTIALGPRYAGLVRDIFQRRRLADDFSLYLHRPSATDPSVAPPGCDAFYVLSPVPQLESGTDWNREAEAYRRRIEAHLEQRLLPGLREAIVTSRVMTPAHFRDELLACRGAAFGPQPLLSQSAWFRPHNRSEDIRNLFLVGAGTHPGAGVPGVLSSARVLDRVLAYGGAGG